MSEGWAHSLHFKHQIPGFPQHVILSPMQELPYTESALPEWHRSENVGQAWRNFKWFCIPMTICHTIDNNLRQVICTLQACCAKLSQRGSGSRPLRWILLLPGVASVLANWPGKAIFHTPFWSSWIFEQEWNTPGAWLKTSDTYATTQVDKVHAVWGESIGFALGTNQDHRDIYNRQLQLYENHNPNNQRVKTYEPMRSSKEGEADQVETIRPVNI